MESLLWAVSYMRDMRIILIRFETDWFETDCSDKIDMIANLMDWLAFLLEIDVFQILDEVFENVSLIHISRRKNDRATF